MRLRYSAVVSYLSFWSDFRSAAYASPLPFALDCAKRVIRTGLTLFHSPASASGVGHR
ncbi:hypothetical protein PCO31111_01044 [Pandoraea communis]|uniref:Uncharacterized protein n=1 Tax=Pandoraea communis TaxID=2508297 RepID=A0A5E4SUG4_9BURK|nr:hypothetical protein PCO31111_01044 [Pandoraea communis]